MSTIRQGYVSFELRNIHRRGMGEKLFYPFLFETVCELINLPFTLYYLLDLGCSDKGIALCLPRAVQRYRVPNKRRRRYRVPP